MATEVFQVVFSGHLSGQFVQNVLHVNATLAGTPNPYATAVLIADAINTGGIQEKWTDQLPVDYTQTSLRVKRLLPSGGPTAIITGGGLTQPAGQRTGSISSAQVSPLIIWIGTDLPTKTGRTFLPGVSETDIDDMVLTSGLITAIDAFIADWITQTAIGSDAFIGSIGRRTPTPDGDVIIAGNISPLIGTQRRRLRPV